LPLQAKKVFSSSDINNLPRLTCIVKCREFCPLCQKIVKG
jgi:hypothetical protein